MILQNAMRPAHAAASQDASGAGRPRPPAPRSIQWHLGVLCIAFILPVLGFVGWVLWQYTGAERAHLQQQGTELLHEISAAVERDLAVQSSMTELAGYSPPLMSEDLAAVHRASSELARALDIRILLRTPVGQQLVDTAVTWGTPLGREARDEDAQVLRTKRPVVSNLVEDPRSRAPAIAITAPVLRPGTGEVASLLSFVLSPQRVVQAMTQASARIAEAPGALVLVLDANGRVIAASRTEGIAVGQTVPWLGVHMNGRDGRVRATGPDGDPFVAQYARLSGANWTVVSGTEEAALEAPMWRFLLQIAAVGMALGLLSPALAFTFGRRITGAIDQLRGAAASLGKGKPVAAVETPVSQVNEVGAALHAAGVAIQDGQERQALLNRELHHRVKNNLATVQAVINSTARSAGSLEGFRDALLKRIASLARTHDLLIVSTGAGASLEDLIRNELQPYEDAATRRITFGGPPVQLNADMALPIGMVLHELATNAAKYGALSVPGGSLSVTWKAGPHENAPWMTLDWIESGGPPVTRPEKPGFGSMLLDRVGRQLNGVIHKDFAPGGLRVRLMMPLEPGP